MVRDFDAADGRGEELALLAAVLLGDTSAWEQFFKRYQGLIAACIRKALHRYSASFENDDIADLIADVWVALLKDDRHKLRKFDPTRGYRLGSWIGLIATNTTIDALRARSSRLRFIEDIEGFAERHLVDQRSPQHVLERNDAARVAKVALEQLDAEEQRFVVACFHEERPAATLATEFGVSVNTVYSRKFKVRSKLVRIAEHMEQATLAAA
ncbi:MAG: sigma-70 family RNA polymerase sigma factor [Deltaproteobacteria bacterium]|nr:sigma-70 family RNA polymerase sigma factor [Deltaproteobacteria bacterium]